MLSNLRVRNSTDYNRRRNYRFIIHKIKEMKKQITLDTLLIASVTLFLAFIAGYVNIRSVLADHEARLKSVEQSNAIVILKLDKISDQQTTILVKMEDKQNRAAK